MFTRTGGDLKMSKWLKKDDRVVVISGNDKGKTGTILQKKEDRVIVSGVNVRKKHMKRTQQNQSAQIVEMERPIHISNVNFCTEGGKAVSVKVRFGTEGQKELYYSDQGKETVLRQI